MSFQISLFKAALGLGVRPNLFAVSIESGTAGQLTLSTQSPVNNIYSLVKSAQLPGSSIGTIEVPQAGGRRLKLAGDRTFAEWTMTVINDEAYAARNLFKNYQNLLVNADYGATTIGTRGTALCTVTVDQLDVDGNTLKKRYKLLNAFITDISAVDLSYDSTDAISEFTVTWAYDYFTTGSALDDETTASAG